MKLIVLFALVFSFHAFAQENDAHEKDTQASSVHQHPVKNENADVEVENKDGDETTVSDTGSDAADDSQTPEGGHVTDDGQAAETTTETGA